MTEKSAHTTFALNRDTYQRLKLALGLNLRRQIFIAVCDDLPLRDRLIAKLQQDLAHLSTQPSAQLWGEHSPAPGERLVTLKLNPADPNPIAQISHWFSQETVRSLRHADLPAFQITGIEQLTRQTAAAQRSFWTHLQAIERGLPGLDASLLLWMPQPWFRALPQSAPEFWRCRTAVFEFVGDPRPLPGSALVGSTHASSVAAPAVARLQQTTETVAMAVATSSLTRTELATLAATPGGGTPAEPRTNRRDPLSLLPREWLQETDDLPEFAFPQSPSDRGNHPAESPSETVPTGGVGTATPGTKLPGTEPPSTTPSSGAPSGTQPPGSTTDLQQLRQQVEALRQRGESPEAIADAYWVLGEAYRDRIEAGYTEPSMLAAAIDTYEQLLRWLTQDSNQWSNALNDLGNLYWLQSRQALDSEAGLAALSQSIQSYQMALTRLHPEDEEQGYPMIQNNLGVAYADLGRYRDLEDNVQRSIQAYREALRFRTPDADPLQYATTQNNLGTAYWTLSQHRQPQENLKQAIASYSAALRYYDPALDPLNYAMIQNNLGTAYWTLSQHEQPLEYLPQAIAAYEAALQYRTPETAPAAAAATQNNLGTAYWHLATHYTDQPAQQTLALQHSIQSYERAIAIARSLDTPLNFDVFATHHHLALAQYQLGSLPHLSAQVADSFSHLESALHHHLQALPGSQDKPDLKQTVFNGIVQTIRAIHTQRGTTGQNWALSQVPATLLPALLPRL